MREILRQQTNANRRWSRPQIRRARPLLANTPAEIWLDKAKRPRADKPAGP